MSMQSSPVPVSLNTQKHNQYSNKTVMWLSKSTVKQVGERKLIDENILMAKNIFKVRIEFSSLALPAVDYSCRVWIDFQHWTAPVASMNPTHVTAAASFANCPIITSARTV